MNTVQLIYPETRKVSHEQVLLWATDAFSNGETSEIAFTIQDAVRILMDLGQITVERDGIYFDPLGAA